MPQDQLTISQLGQQTKAKYPQYSSMSDEEVGNAVLKKYPQYQSSIIAESVQKKSEVQSSNGSVVSSPQSKQDIPPLSKPTEDTDLSPTSLIKEFGGAVDNHVNALQNIKDNFDVYSQPIPKNAPLRLPTKEEQVAIEPNIVSIGRVNGAMVGAGNVIDYDKPNQITQWAQRQLESLDSSIVSKDPHLLFAKDVAKSVLGSISGLGEGLQQATKGQADVNLPSSQNKLAALELPAGLVKAGFSGLSLVLPSLAAFNVGITAAEDVLPEQWVQTAMSPFSTRLQKTHGIINFNGKIYDIGNSDGVKAAAELTDFLWDIFLFKKAEGLGKKIIHNEILTPIEQGEANKIIDEASKDFGEPFKKETLNKVPSELPDETKIKIAPLIEQKESSRTEINNIQQEKSKLDPSFHEAKDKEISAEEEKIKSADKEIKFILDSTNKTEPIDLPIEPTKEVAKEPFVEETPKNVEQVAESSVEGGKLLESVDMVEGADIPMVGAYFDAGDFGKFGYELPSGLKDRGVTEIKPLGNDTFDIKLRGGKVLKDVVIHKKIGGEAEIDNKSLLTSSDKTQIAYGGKMQEMDIPFKQAAQKVRVNLSSGEKGYVKTPDGKIYEISTSNNSAKLVKNVLPPEVPKDTTKSENRPTEPPTSETPKTKKEKEVVGEQVDVKGESILNRDTDLKGDPKGAWNMTQDEYLSSDAYGLGKDRSINKKEYLGENILKPLRDRHAKFVREAIKDGDYTTAISEGRMTAKDAATIIESAGIEVPKTFSEAAKSETKPTAEVKDGEYVSIGDEVFNSDGEYGLAKQKQSITKASIISAKKKHGDDVIVLTKDKLGDSYEVMGDDAQIVSNIIGTRLTERNKGKADELKLTGFKLSDLDANMKKLVQDGRKVVIIEDAGTGEIGKPIKPPPKDVSIEGKGGEVQTSKPLLAETEASASKEAPKTFTEKGKVLADKIRKLKSKPLELKDENGNIIKVEQAGFDFNPIIDAIADGVEKGGELLDVIKSELEKAKWYQNLTDKGKEAVAKQLSEQFDEGGRRVGVSHKSLTNLAEELGLKEPQRGEYQTPEWYADRGRRLLEAGADPNEVSNPNVALHDRISIGRAHLEDLVSNADEIARNNPDGVNSKEYQDAFKAVDDYAAKTKELGTEAHRAMVSLQGQRDIDTGSFTSVRQAVKDETGTEPSKAQETKIKQLTEDNQKLKEKADELEKKLVEATNENVGKKGATRKQEAKVKLDEAKLAFRKAAGLSSGGLEALPEFVKLVKAYAEYGYESAKEAWAQFQADFPKAKIKQEDFDKHYSEHLAATAKSEATNLEALQKQFVDKKGSKFTLDEAKSIWDYGKKTYLDNGISYREMIGRVAEDLGLTWKQVSEAITSPKTQPIADAMWKKQADLRRNQTATKIWVEQQNKSVYMKALRKASGLIRGIAVFGHGGIFIGTHAGMTLFNPTTWNRVVPAFFRAWRFAYGDVAAYERRIEQLRHADNYVLAQRAGLKNNPDILNTEEFQKSQEFLGKLGLAGERGFNAIKVLRQDLFDYHYERLSDVEKADFNSVVQVAKLINNATGATNLTLPEWVNEASFAGGMEAARWGKLTRNPARATALAIKAIVRPNETTTAEKVFAKVWARRVGEQVGTMATLLTVNAVIQNQIDPKNPTNITNPNQSDFLKFKFGGTTIDPTSGMLGTFRFLYGLGRMPFMSKKELHGDTRVQATGKSAAGYARGKLAPLYSTLADLYTGTDFYGNPLPFSSDKPTSGKHTLSWFEYLIGKSPIPVAEAAKVTFQSAIDQGATKPQINNIMQGLMSGAISGGTGFRVGEYGERPEPFTEEDLKDPAFKYFTDRGMNLPNTSLNSETIHDEVTKTIKKISDYPKEIQDKYRKEHTAQLKAELTKIKNRDYAYVNEYGEASLNPAIHAKKKKLDDLTDEQLAEVLHLTQSIATTKTKEKIFPKKNNSEGEANEVPQEANEVPVEQ